MITCKRCGRESTHPKARFCPGCGMMLGSPDSPADPWLGRNFADRYTILKLLGIGGMSRVYLAEQTKNEQNGQNGQKIALKLLHPDLAAEPTLVARFNREARTVLKLNHPNTITFYDYGQAPDGTLFIAMEYIEGQGLEQVIHSGPLPPERVLGILGQICTSLDEAHKLGIIHRDLKPENIVLAEGEARQDFVKVLDFGIAKRTEADAESLKLTEAGVILGTPPYMSPEQYSGHQLDRRSDIYSLGVMAYEMLTGKLPFHAETPWQWAQQHLTVAPPPFEEVSDGDLPPPDCQQAVFRALSKKPDDRYQTTSEFFESFSESLSKKPSRKQLWLALVAFIVAVALVFLVAAFCVFRC